MDSSYIFIILIVLVGVFWALRNERRRAAALQTYWDRSCQGREWKRAFPDSTAEEIRTFLCLLVDCFGFKAKNQLCFSPKDRLLAIYRASNPDPTAPDILEIETFGRELEALYGLSFSAAWNGETTLGEIYARAKVRPNKSLKFAPALSGLHRTR